MNKLFLIATLLFTSVFSLSAGVVAYADELMAKHKAGETYITNFSELKVIPRAKKETRKAGRLTYTNPSYLRMDYTDPAGDYTLIDSKTFDRARDGKVTHVPQNGKMQLFRDMLLLAFAGNCEEIARQNKALVTYKKEAGKIIADLKSEKGNAFSLLLTYDAKSGCLIEMTITEPSGIYTTYSCQN